ncbi:MAG: glycosyl hydrolase 115 family protein [Rikenellaceae bacterium]
MKKFLLSSVKVVIALLTIFAMACSSPTSCPESSFVISQGSDVATIYVGKDEPYSIRRAVGDLQNDIEMVTGIKPTITNDINSLTGRAIIIGSLANNEIKSLVEANAAEETKGMDKMVEAFLMKPITKPSPKLESALLVVGSDALGAIYGTYQVSELSGVSPLYWWLDATPKKVTNLTISGAKIIPCEATVRYRGIFINDEEALIKWSGNTTPGGYNMGVTPETYKKIFELILRLKANAIWPSMMEPGQFFFQARDEKGIAINPRNATDYGIFVGTSHCENLARNNYDEWYDWAEAHANMYDAKGVAEWDYTVNPKAIEAYWQERLDECKEFNMIYTMGIRGVHDSPFVCRNLKNPTLENKVKLLQKVITRQREMIKDTFGAEDAVPQIFVPYEETGELYNGESKDGKEKCKGLDLPEDIMLVTTEDNYGFTRQLPNERDLKRAGGNGIYYHLVYQGYPSPYDWLSTASLNTLKEQMLKIYDSGATKYWIVNVGDVKPVEVNLKYFMEMAWDVEAARKSTVKEYMSRTSKSLYAVEDATAKECAELLTRFQQITTSQKPEFMSSFWSVDFTIPQNRSLHRFYSTFDYGDEAQRIIEEYKALEADAKKVYDRLGEDHKAPFWHTTYYPIRAARMMTEKVYYYHKNHYYAAQGRFRSVNAYKELSLKAQKEIDEDLDYYNNKLIDGKWNGIMDPYGYYNRTERVYDIAGIPEHFKYAEKFAEEAVEGIGSVCEGQIKGTENTPLLFSSYEDNVRFIDIFTTGLKSAKWNISCNEPWVKFSKMGDRLDVEERVLVKIDWKAIKKSGQNRAVITLTGDNHTKTYNVIANKYDMELAERSYVEGCGFMTIEAEHYTNKVDAKDGSKWEEYPEYGYVGSSMFIKGKDGAHKVSENLQENSARLEYNVYFASKGTFRGILYRIPTLNEGKGMSCEIAIGVDDEEPQVLQGVRHKGQFLTTKMLDGEKESRRWHTNVFMQMEKIPFVIKVKRSGYHTIKLYEMDNHIGVDRIVISTSKETILPLKRGIIAATESYNNINESYKSPKCTASPKINKDQACVEAYPNPEPMLYTKHHFTQLGAPAVWGFTPVSNYDVYDPRVNTYGWGKTDFSKLATVHNESMRYVPHWQRDMIRGVKPATFSMKMLRGRYDVTLYTGYLRYTYANNPGIDLQMSVKANGKTVIDNELFKENEAVSRKFEVRVGNDNTMNLEFSGKWGVAAIEVYRK